MLASLSPSSTSNLLAVFLTNTVRRGFAAFRARLFVLPNPHATDDDQPIYFADVVPSSERHLVSAAISYVGFTQP